MLKPITAQIPVQPSRIGFGSDTTKNRTELLGQLLAQSKDVVQYRQGGDPKALGELETIKAAILNTLSEPGEITGFARSLIDMAKGLTSRLIQSEDSRAVRDYQALQLTDLESKTMSKFWKGFRTALKLD